MPEPNWICLLPGSALVDRSLSDGAFRVLGILMSNCSDGRLCTLSNQEISARGAHKPDQVSRLLGELEVREYVRLNYRDEARRSRESIEVMYAFMHQGLVKNAEPDGGGSSNITNPTTVGYGENDEPQADAYMERPREENSLVLSVVGLAGADERIASMLTEKFRDEDNADFYRQRASLLLQSYPEPVIKTAILDAPPTVTDGRGMFRYIDKSLPDKLKNYRAAQAAAAEPIAASPPIAATNGHRRQSNADRRAAESQARDDAIEESMRRHRGGA